MKKSTLLSMALFALTATSCQNDEQEPQLVRNNTLQAVVADAAASRAAFDPQGKFFWTKGDQIAVNVTGGAKSFKTMDLVGGAGTPEATFSCQLSEGEQFDQWAVYPASMNPAINGNDILYTLPAAYTLTGSIDTAFPKKNDADAQSFNSPMLGKVNSVDGKINFKNLCGVACFHFNIQKEAKGGTFLFQLEASSPIAGTFKVSTLENDMQVLSNTNVAKATNPSKSVKVKFVMSAENGVIYVPIPIGTYSKMHCKVNYLFEDGSLGATMTERTIYNVESKANSLINYRLPLYNQLLFMEGEAPAYYEKILSKAYDDHITTMLYFEVWNNVEWECIKKVNGVVVEILPGEIEHVDGSHRGTSRYKVNVAVQPNNSNSPKLIIYEFINKKTGDLLAQLVVNQAGKP